MAEASNIAGRWNFGGELSLVTSSAIRSLGLTAPSSEILHLAALLAIIQIIDGLFTAIGISTFGLTMEANPFIRHLMSIWGCIPTLILVKSFAILVIAALCMLSRSISWMALAIRGVIAIYIVLAIVPWSALLIRQAI